MTPHELRARTKRFAIAVIHFYVALPPKDPERVIGRQLLRSGTSVGANYRAVCRARSWGGRREFVLARDPRWSRFDATVRHRNPSNRGWRIDPDLGGFSRDRPP